ncbi:MAG: electron transfer flavoprotein subunit beta/FixA family protein [Vulcanimicrobiota bacterium]
MNIIACVRQTPDTETVIKINGAASGIELDGVKLVLGPYDEYALEAAAQIKEKSGGEVTAVTVGGEKAAETLRHCLAVGADKAVHINDGGADDALAIATALANQIKKMPHDLVFVSNKGTDSDRGAVGPMLGELLGLPYVGLVTEIEVEGGSATVSRDVEGGAKEKFKVTLPAVICAQKGVRGEPRYASLPAIMKAKKKPIETVSPEGDLASLRKVQVEKLEYPPARPPGRMVPGESAADKAKELVRLLRSEAKVI